MAGCVLGTDRPEKGVRGVLKMGKNGSRRLSALFIYGLRLRDVERLAI